MPSANNVASVRAREMMYASQITNIPDSARMKGIKEITAVNIGDAPSTTAAYTETNSDASLCMEFPRSLSIAASSVLSFFLRSALSVMKAPKSPDTPMAKQAPSPAVTMISGCVTFTIQAPTMMPSTVMDPSNPFLIKYRLAMGLISVIRR